MKRKYSIIVVPPDQNKPPRQFHFSNRTKQAVMAGTVAIGLFVGGVMAHDIYQNKYINEYQTKFAYVDHLEMELKAKEMEIARLNEKTSEINNNLMAIASLENKITEILKINNNQGSEISRNSGGASVQSFNLENIDQASGTIEAHKTLMEEYYDETLKYEDKQNHTPSILPVNGPISSPFGYRRNPFGGWSSEFHNGIDISCGYGTPVRSTADGVVTFAGWDGYWGYRVEVSHGYGVVTFYAHNSRITVRTGEEVKKGEVVAYSGSSGRSTGSHLHYTAYINGKVVDPLVFTTYTKEQ